ncbi:MAG TPA: hypothetical protein VFF98_14820 [Novosphingobium sp.]|nr:hypothetical protein [Novosphingobium sp.]
MPFLRFLAALLALAIATPAAAQVTLPQIKNAGGASVPSTGAVIIDSSGAEKGTSANPLYITCWVGGCYSTIAGPSGNQAAVDTSSRLSVSVNNTPYVQPLYAAPASYTTGTWFDARAYGSVTFTAVAAATAAYSPKWSPDGGTTVAAMTCIDLNFTTQTSFGATAATAITCKGGGYLELTGGTGGTFMLNAGQ